MSEEVGRYEILEEIGQGGFAIVYRARDTELGRLVALKELRPTLLNDGEWVKRFKREARTIAQLNYPRIVTIHDVVELNHRLFIVMHLVDGASLEALIVEQGRMPWSRTLAIMTAIAEALDFAHAADILHRDLKPANILIDSHRGPLLTDFGLAKLAGEAGTSVTAAGGIVGTPHYIAPEVWEGQGTSKQSDIYALGCILYELLTGRKLFGGNSPPAVMMAHFSPPSLPDTWPEDVPAGIADILKIALAKSPNERYATAGDLVVALTNLAGAGVAEVDQAGRGKEVQARPQEGLTGYSASTDPTRYQQSNVQNRLPQQPSPFIGREAELAALDELIADPASRLLTIVGPGGMGKTRLSLAVAERQFAKGESSTRPYFPNGVHFVPLAPLSSAATIIPTMAEALDFQLETGGPKRSPQQQILDYLSQKRMLIVLDNFEHLLDGVDIVADILRAAPEVKLLVTSRERLHLREEQLFVIQGLEFPETIPQESAETVKPAADYTAVQLFIQSAQRVQHDFELAGGDLTHLARICRLVEGMPLGIELAASWVDTLSLADIAVEIQQSLDLLETNMRNVPERHRSIRAVFDYSWQRMSEVEREIFAQLSIFRGGFTRQAAQQITGASLRVLGTLTSKSHLQYHKARDRYQIHELLRQYSAEKLAENPGVEATVRDRHCAYYCEALRQREAALKGPEQLTALAEIEADFENVRLAWDWAVERGQLTQIGQALESLARFYEWQGRYLEGEAGCRSAAGIVAAADEPRISGRVLIWQATFLRMLGQAEESNRLLQQVLKLLDSFELAELDTRQERAAILLSLARLARDAGNSQEARQMFEQSLALYQGIDDRWGMAKVLTELCFVVRNFGDTGTFEQRRRQIEQSEQIARQSVEICREIGDRGGLVDAVTQLGAALFFLGRLNEACSIMAECITLATELERRGSVVLATFFLGSSNLLLGHYKQARNQLQLALNLAREIHYDSQVGTSLYNLGILEAVEGAYARAESLLYESLEIHRKSDNRHEQALSLIWLGFTERGLGNLIQAQQHLIEALRIALEIWSWVRLWLAVLLAAVLWADRGEPDRAVELHKLFMSLALGEWASSPLIEDLVGRHLAAVAATLPPEAVAAAEARGRDLDLWETGKALLAELEADNPGNEGSA